MSKSLLLNILAGILISYVLICVLVFFTQRQLIYFPNSQDFYSCMEFADAEAREFQGTRFYYKENSDRVAVFYHGNAGSACDRAFLKPLFEKSNVSYIFVEYAGYSNSPASPSKKTLFKNAENIHAFVKSLNASEVIVIGESIGAAIAAYHTSLGSVDKVLIISPFTTLSELASYHYPYLPIRILLRDKYDNSATLKEYKDELLIIHGTDDTIVPLRFSENLFESLPSTKKSRVIIEGNGHNDIYTNQKVIDAMQRFLTRFNS